MRHETSDRQKAGFSAIDTLAEAPAPACAVHVDEGFCAGTTILTLDGELPVDHLQPGDRVITRDSGVATLRGIVSQVRKVAPVRIKAGSLGHTRPDRDMILPPATRLHIRDWRAEALFGTPTAMIAAERLIDGEFIATGDVQSMTVHRLTFDAPHIVYADGLEVAVG